MPSTNSEDRVAATLAAILGCRAERQDVGGGQIGVRDFDLVYDDGRREPLEVTVAMDEPVVHSQARLRELSGPAASLQRYWVIEVPNREITAVGNQVAANMRRLYAVAEPALSVLEQAGRHMFSFYEEAYQLDPSIPGDAAILRLAAAGIGHGRSVMIGNGPGRISPAMVYSCSIVGATVAQAVAGEAAKADNQAKLREPPNATRRHLAVAIDASVGPASTAMRHGTPGDPPASVPAPITTVWALAWSYVAYSDPPNPWTVVTTPTEAVEHPERYVS